MRIEGGCHCGNIRYVLDWPGDGTDIRIRACGCAFCTKHGGVWTSNPRGSLRVAIADPVLVSEYEFGTRTAKFHICRACGIVPVVTSEIDGRLYAVVSVNAFEGVEPSLLQRLPVSFDDEAQGERLARRARNWIADVEFGAAGRA